MSTLSSSASGRSHFSPRGFTLLELVTTLSVLSLLLGTGVPAMHALLQKTRMTTHINTFVTHLHHARSAAIKQGHNVVMCRSADLLDCSRTEGWEVGWLVFADSNFNRQRDADERILAVEQGWRDGIRVSSGQRRRVVYQPTGFSPGTNGTYIFCDPDYPDTARAVIISNSGRPRLSTTRPDGSPLGCGT